MAREAPEIVPGGLLPCAAENFGDEGCQGVVLAVAGWLLMLSKISVAPMSPMSPYLNITRTHPGE